MNCSPCGSGSNYTSISSTGCVTLCGAGISTIVMNTVTVSIPSTINVSISSIGVSTLGSVSVTGNTYDTFSRLITATPTTMLTAHTAFTPMFQILGYTSTGSGSIVCDLSNSIVLMSTITTAGRSIRQTLEYQLYEPGKAHQAIMTWTPQFSGTFDDSVAVRCGIYDDYRDKNTPSGAMGTGAASAIYVSSINGGLGVETNQYSMGHYFELSGNSWFVVERANSSNNIANVTRVAQSNWSIDTLNSNFPPNPSGVQLSKSDDQIFFIERQWLGVGLVRLGIFNGGKQIIAHQFQNRKIKQPYTHLNKLPLRYEIEKVEGGSSNAATTGSMCMSSQIDGEYTPIGVTFSLPPSIIQTTTKLDTVLRPIILIRLQQQYCRATVKIKAVDLFGGASGSGVFTFLKNHTITGTITWVNHPDSRSMVQYANFAGNGNTIPTNTVSGGQCMQTGFYTAKSAQTMNQSVSDLIAATSICSDIKGVPDVFCVAMSGFAGNELVNACPQWLEII